MEPNSWILDFRNSGHGWSLPFAQTFGKGVQSVSTGFAAKVHHDTAIQIVGQIINDEVDIGGNRLNQIDSGDSMQLLPFFL